MGQTLRCGAKVKRAITVVPTPPCVQAKATPLNNDDDNDACNARGLIGQVADLLVDFSLHGATATGPTRNNAFEAFGARRAAAISPCLRDCCDACARRIWHAGNHSEAPYGSMHASQSNELDQQTSRPHIMLQLVSSPPSTWLVPIHSPSWQEECDCVCAWFATHPGARDDEPTSHFWRNATC